MRGLVFEWSVAVLGIFVVALIFITINEAYIVSGGIYDYGNDNIQTVDTEGRAIFNIFDTIWRLGIPWILMIAFLLYAINRGQRRSDPFQGVQ